MNRRSLVLAGIAAPLPLWHPVSQSVEAAFEIDGLFQTYFHISAHLTERSAEVERRSLIGRPFGDLIGEFYVTSTNTIRLPSDIAAMPGTVTHHNTVVGVAAVEGAAMVGAFRRATYVFGIRMFPDDLDLMLTLARDFQGKVLPHPLSVLKDADSLRSILPDSDDLGLSVTPIDGLWP